MLLASNTFAECASVRIMNAISKKHIASVTKLSGGYSFQNEGL